MKDKFGNNYRLPQERWRHILTNHPELRGKKHDVGKVLSDPDIIVKAYNDPAILVYHRKDRQKHLIAVVAHSQKGFIITAFITNKIKIGKIIWQKNKTNN